MGSFITERSDESADEEDDGEPPKVLFQRVLKHNILQVLPSVVDASLRLQAIWILAQFVVSSDLQKVLLGLVRQDRYAGGRQQRALREVAARRNSNPSRT